MSKEIDLKELQNYITFLEDKCNNQQQKIEQLEKEVDKAKSNWVIYQDMLSEEYKKNTKLKERVKELEVKEKEVFETFGKFCESINKQIK